MYHLVCRGAEFEGLEDIAALGGVSSPGCGGAADGGRQEADLQRKKRKHGRLRFFLPLGPQLRLWVAPPPLSP